MDRGLWITWYDLADEGREAYLSWLHRRYIPRLLERPGFLWAAHYRTEAAAPRSGVPAGAPGRLRHTSDPAVPAGNAYILLVGATDVHAFGRLTPEKLHAALEEEDRRMLALRRGERVNLLAEEARANGPEARRRRTGGVPAACIQLGTFNAGDADDAEILAWYAQWRMPCMRRLPGCVGIRKLVSVAGWAKHGVLYEFVSLAARNRHFPDHEKSNPEMAAWTDRLVRELLHAPGSPNVAQRIFGAARRTRRG